MAFINESPRQVPVIYEADVCVLGGSATGVFAAIRAARLGAKAVIVERMNSFGGNATNGFMPVWHSFWSTDGKKQIIAGLSDEAVQRLDPMDYRGGGVDSYIFNPVEMKCELDLMLEEAGVKTYLHTFYAGLAVEDDEIKAVFVENKDGRGAIKAKFYIDATGDGDLCRDLGIERYTNGKLQPPSYVFLMQGADGAFDPASGKIIDESAGGVLNAHREEFGVELDHGWYNDIPSHRNIKFRVDTHVFYVNCAIADELTKAEIVGRQKMTKLVKAMRKYGIPGEKYSALKDASYIGIRDTFHYRTKYQAEYIPLFTGTRYEDNILNGTYSGDVQNEVDGTTFMELDGTYHRMDPHGRHFDGNWREENGLPTDCEMPTYYSLPFKTLVPEKIKNFIAAGRMINADPTAFGALRVMCNLNQIGEAAGVAAYLAIHQNKSVQELDGVEVARTLKACGSANLD